MKHLTLSILLFSLSLSLYSQWVSLDSGTNQDLWAISFADENVGYAGGGPWQFSSNCVITKTVDGGENWVAQNPVSFVSCIFGLTALNADTIFAVGCNATAYYGLILRSFDGGESWTTKNISNSWGFYCVEFPTESIGYTCGWNGRIYKTIDAGENWSSLPSGSSLTFRRMSIIDENLGFAACGSDHASTNKIYKTTNGNNWSLVTNFGSSFIIGGMHFFDENNGVVVGVSGNSAAIKRTSDGGENWDDVLIGNYSLVLEALHFEGNRGWAAGKSGGNSAIFYSNNGGETWELNSQELTHTPYGIASADTNYYIAGISGMIMSYSGDPSVGLFSPEKRESLNLFPNPASNIVSVDLINYPSAKSFEIYNVIGGMVLRKNITDEQLLRVDISSLEKGVYLVKLSSEKQNYSSKLIVKN